MKYPKEQLYLVELFLKKRDPRLGGVNSFVGSFQFDYAEIDPIVIPSKAMLKEILNLFKTKLIFFEGKEESIILDYEPKTGGYIINGCYTPQLQKHQIMLKNQLSRETVKPIIFISTARKIIWKDKKTDDQSLLISKRQAEMLAILEDGLEKKTSALFPNEENTSIPQILSRAKRTLNSSFKTKYGFVDDIIKGVPRRGYKINSDKYIFKYLKE